MRPSRSITSRTAIPAAQDTESGIAQWWLAGADAIPPGRLGRVEVGAAPVEEGRLRITVSDDGQGIAPEVLRRAFEPFFSTKGEGRGSGLGLPVARALVESHGGELRLQSELGQGTRAVLELPEARPVA